MVYTPNEGEREREREKERQRETEREKIPLVALLKNNFIVMMPLGLISIFPSSVVTEDMLLPRCSILVPFFPMTHVCEASIPENALHPQDLGTIPHRKPRNPIRPPACQLAYSKILF